MALTAALAAVVTMGCASDTCTTGMTIACACTDGRTGAQACKSDGTYDECVCTSGGVDAGPVDSGSLDSGSLDSGATDSGRADGGEPRDASTTDAGGDVDSGRPSDAGRDAGSDSGTAGFVVNFPEDSARVIIHDTLGDLYPNEFTFELWIRFNRMAPTITQSIFLAEGGSGALRLWIDERDTLECIVSGSSGYVRAQLPDSSGTVSVGVWHHLACTGDGAGRVTLWLDGVEVGTQRDGLGYRMPGAGYPFALGSGPNTPPPTTWRFNGQIDDFRISNRRRYVVPFTPSRSLTADASTIALFHFDEGAGTTTSDAFGHTGALGLGATWAPE